MFSSLISAASALGAIAASAVREPNSQPPRLFLGPKAKGKKRNPAGTRCRVRRAAANRYVYALKGLRP